MVAVRIIDLPELEKRLAPYQCKRMAVYDSGLEVWETGWGEPFTLWSEGGRYDEWQYFQLVGGLIAATMPEDWNGR